MKITLNNKEYTIKFGYAPVLKNGFIKDVSRALSDNESVENILLFLPHALLIGLQVNHSDEFGFTNEQEKEEQENKLLEMLGNEVDNDNINCLELYWQIVKELEENSFLKQMLEKEMQKQQKLPAKKRKVLKSAEN